MKNTTLVDMNARLGLISLNFELDMKDLYQHILNGHCDYIRAIAHKKASYTDSRNSLKKINDEIDL